MTNIFVFNHRLEETRTASIWVKKKKTLIVPFKCIFSLQSVFSLCWAGLYSQFLIKRHLKGEAVQVAWMSPRFGLTEMFKMTLNTGRGFPESRWCRNSGVCSCTFNWSLKGVLYSEISFVFNVNVRYVFKLNTIIKCCTNVFFPLSILVWGGNQGGAFWFYVKLRAFLFWIYY